MRVVDGSISSNKSWTGLKRFVNRSQNRFNRWLKQGMRTSLQTKGRHIIRKAPNKSEFVTPAKAGVQINQRLDARLCGHDNLFNVSLRIVIKQPC